LRVAALNVWNTDDRRRLDQINRELKRLDPDLVAFQEMRKPQKQLTSTFHPSFAQVVRVIE
jgi:hypothetical protein